MKTIYVSAFAVLAMGATAAQSQNDGFYFGGSLGIVQLQDATNEGAFAADFTGGGAPSFPGATPTDPLVNLSAPAGTGVGWDTEFDTGSSLGAFAGLRSGKWRYEAEVFRQSNDVNTHTGVSAADSINLTNEDAAVLVSGQPTNLGITVGDLVADGQGEVKQLGFMGNVFYDFDTGTAITPYIGAGIGMANVKIEYAPSATPIIDDDQSVLAYQIMAGASLLMTEQIEVFGGVRYRATDAVDVDASLFPASFDIENSAVNAEIGVRFNF